MTQLLVVYNAPSDPAAFQSYYRETHLPLAKKIPGLRELVVSDGAVQALSGNAPYLVANLTFDSMTDLQTGLASPEGQAAAGDLHNFASGGATLLIFESKTV